jgi:hypothetical protein
MHGLHFLTCCKPVHVFPLLACRPSSHQASLPGLDIDDTCVLASTKGYGSRTAAATPGIMICWHSEIQLPEVRVRVQSKCQRTKPYQAACPTPLLTQWLLAGALVSVLINLFKRSPVKPTETLIDFHVAIALTPVVLVSNPPA